MEKYYCNSYFKCKQAKKRKCECDGLFFPIEKYNQNNFCITEGKRMEIKPFLTEFQVMVGEANKKRK